LRQDVRDRSVIPPAGSRQIDGKPAPIPPPALRNPLPVYWGVEQRPHSDSALPPLAQGADLSDTVYVHLRAIAARLMADERANHTLQPTALVSEAYLRLATSQGDNWATPAEFYRAAAAAMRRILIDHARRRGAVKRGGDWRRVSLEAPTLQTDDDLAMLLFIEEAVERLHAESPRAAEVVRLRFFGGLSVEQTAAAMGLSVRTVMRAWEYARAWLLVEMQPRSE
jgi:RNA polymerase sigma-70 factor, ECF subfamily